MVSALVSESPSDNNKIPRYDIQSFHRKDRLEKYTNSAQDLDLAVALPGNQDYKPMESESESLLVLVLASRLVLLSVLA